MPLNGAAYSYKQGLLMRVTTRRPYFDRVTPPWLLYLSGSNLHIQLSEIS